MAPNLGPGDGYLSPDMVEVEVGGFTAHPKAGEPIVGRDILDDSVVAIDMLAGE